MPAWIVEMWQKDYGDDKTESVLKATTRDKYTFIRCNTNKISTEQLIEKLKSENVNARYAKDVLADDSLQIPDYALVIDDYDYLEALESFNEGCFWVQDISSMLAAGDVIEVSSKCLDVCAAPGGKSLNAAAIAVNGTVESRDVSDYKVSLINENLNRLGFSNITTKVWDARVLYESDVEKFDVVIADLPCSGLGISGRKPDIRYNATPEAVGSLSALQREILKVVSQYVKPGGVLIYSTCTLTKAENDQNAAWIAQNLPFDAISDATTIFPGELGTDGFFIARFRRK
jgi:16S rRNA (cytosine967-C5)-methyltransferase